VIDLRVNALFFDRKAVLDAGDKPERVALPRVGAFIRTMARASLVRCISMHHFRHDALPRKVHLNAPYGERRVRLPSGHALNRSRTLVDQDRESATLNATWPRSVTPAFFLAETLSKASAVVIMVQKRKRIQFGNAGTGNRRVGPQGIAC